MSGGDTMIIMQILCIYTPNPPPLVLREKPSKHKQEYSVWLQVIVVLATAVYEYTTWLKKLYWYTVPAVIAR